MTDMTRREFMKYMAATATATYIDSLFDDSLFGDEQDITITHLPQIHQFPDLALHKFTQKLNEKNQPPSVKELIYQTLRNYTTTIQGSQKKILDYIEEEDITEVYIEGLKKGTEYSVSSLLNYYLKSLADLEKAFDATGHRQKLVKDGMIYLTVERMKRALEETDVFPIDTYRRRVLETSLLPGLPEDVLTGDINSCIQVLLKEPEKGMDFSKEYIEQAIEIFSVNCAHFAEHYSLYPGAAIVLSITHGLNLLPVESPETLGSAMQFLNEQFFINPQLTQDPRFKEAMKKREKEILKTIINREKKDDGNAVLILGNHHDLSPYVKEWNRDHQDIARIHYTRQW